MNKLRKALVLSLACLLLLTTFAAGALASIQAQPYTFDGRCLRTFITDGSLEVPIAHRPHQWQQFSVTISDLTYEGSSAKTYAYARPVSANGGVSYATRQVVNLTNPTYFTLNDSGITAVQIKTKLYNAFYEDSGSQAYRLSIAGTVRGVFKDMA